MLSREQSFSLETNAICWSRGSEVRRVAFSDVKAAHYRGLAMRGTAAVQKKVMWRLHLRCRSGRQLVLSPLHYMGFRHWQDRSAAYWNFVNQLLAELRRIDPEFPIEAERHWTMRLQRSIRRRGAAAGGWAIAALLPVVRRREPNRTINVSAWLMRHLGPLLRHHRMARLNLEAAFPAKSEAEIDLILSGMWDSFGRTIGEYAYLEQLWDFDPNAPEAGRIVIDRTTLNRVASMRADDKPALYFAAHLSNWEIPAIAANALGLKVAVLYRAREFGLVADRVADLRAQLMGPLISADPGAAHKLRQALKAGLGVATFVDQHFGEGVEATFFGRRCKVNPALGRLARQLDCVICGSRAIRLPGNRYRVELTDPLPLPRDLAGKPDVAATMQLVTTVIEAWIREYPEQWLWMHRRWR